MLANLKLLRTEKNITQQALAEAVGTSQQAINKYENQPIEPDISMLCKIADFFDVSVDFLIGHTHIREKNIGIQESCLNDEEAGFLQLFRKLSSPVKMALYNLMQLLYNQSKP